MTPNSQARASGGAGRHRAARPDGRLARVGRWLFASVDRWLLALEIRTIPHHFKQIESDRVETMEDHGGVAECDECEGFKAELEEAQALGDDDQIDEVNMRWHDHVMEARDA